MTGKTGVARLRQAIENQWAAGEACFSLSTGEATAICDECEDELARLAWAKGVPVPKDADGNVVPLDTTELYTDEGEMVCVWSICFNQYFWHVRRLGDGRPYRLDKLHRTERDSWALLERDVLTLAKCKFLADPEGDAKECVSRAKALAERDAKGPTPQPSPHGAKEANHG